MHHTEGWQHSKHAWCFTTRLVSSHTSAAALQLESDSLPNDSLGLRLDEINMQHGGHNPVYVAPLRIRKSQKDLREAQDPISRADSQTIHHRQPSDLPDSEPYSPKSRFQNFLRASYPYQPVKDSSQPAVTLPLAAGDVILVHSIHTNGWADGTSLVSGERGWAPTNFCEPYEYAPMRSLLRALTEFWDFIRGGSEDTIELFRNHDYMRGMVAGVRVLLEKSDCLTRDSTLVKQHDNLRKIRKALLADLSTLVKTSKLIQQPAPTPQTHVFTEVQDDVLFKAFQVVTRAVHFYDIWCDEASYAQGLGQATAAPAVVLEPTSPSGSSTIYGAVSRDTSKRTSMYSSHSALSMAGLNVNRMSRPRPASISRPPSLTHRMSYAGRSLANAKGNGAAEQLSDTYDAFLGVLASFLGSHMQSRSSSELLLTTQQAVKSCRKLLEIVEIVLEHCDFQSDGLQQAKDFMYDKITDLVHAAQEVFRPLQSEDDDFIYLPGEGAKLVNAATACVSGAGRCVAKANELIREIGNFEVELRGEYSRVPSPFDHHPFQSPDRTPLSGSVVHIDSTASSRRHSQSHLQPVELSGSAQEHVLNSLAPTPITPAASSATWTPMTDATESLRSVTLSDSSVEINSIEPMGQSQQQKALTRAMLHGSESTLVSARDSGPSFVSQTSTRATSPDSHMKTSPKVEVDVEDDEEALIATQFAHELIVAPDGHIQGGSLNAIIERLTSHESKPEPSFVTMVYLTFRLFATPTEFAEALAFRYDSIGESPRVSQLVRLRVSNIFKGWLESHWRHDCDEPTIPLIRYIVQQKIAATSSTAAHRLLELLDTVATCHGPAAPRVQSAIGKTSTAASSSVDPDAPAPAAVLSRSQLNSLKAWKMGGSGLSILEFDAIELARQLTIKTSAIFCSILPEELVGCEFMKDSNSLAVNLRELSTLSNDLHNLVVESVLEFNDSKKRAQVLKQWIKIAMKCLELNNYETMFTIIASINSSSIRRMKRTWGDLSQKTKARFEELSQIMDPARNHKVLRDRLELLPPPCLPFVGLYRTDLTFVDQGNPATKDLRIGDDVISVINIDKHAKTAKIISDLQRFQIPYRLSSVDELQTWIQGECIRFREAGETRFQNQYRRSLILEPKQEPQTLTAKNKMGSFPSLVSLKSKERLDFFWIHGATKEMKERHNSVGS